LTRAGVPSGVAPAGIAFVNWTRCGIEISVSTWRWWFVKSILLAGGEAVRTAD